MIAKRKYPGDQYQELESKGITFTLVGFGISDVDQVKCSKGCYDKRNFHSRVVSTDEIEH